MKHKLALTLGCAFLGIVGDAVIYVWAQTVAPGPYYAWPSWDQTLPSSTRFVVLSNMGSNAVLDRETGLVWERSPLAPSPLPLPNGTPGTLTWGGAIGRCNFLTKGNRQGWRLPAIHELASLIDPSASTGPKLPPGHPFIDVQSSHYWSATTAAFNNDFVRILDFSSGDVSTGNKTVTEFFAWCVRGGQGADAH